MSVTNSITYFNIAKDKVGLFHDATAYGEQTVAEFRGSYFYLGHQPCNLASAAMLYEAATKTSLSELELNNLRHANDLSDLYCGAV